MRTHQRKHNIDNLKDFLTNCEHSLKKYYMHRCFNDLDVFAKDAATKQHANIPIKLCKMQVKINIIKGGHMPVITFTLVGLYWCLMVVNFNGSA